jgi:hypothetical protein
METLTNTLWPLKKHPLTSSGLSMSNIKQKTNTGSVTTILRNTFWTGIAVLNVLIFVDIFGNYGKNLIDILFVLTIGNRG